MNYTPEDRTVKKYTREQVQSDALLIVNKRDKKEYLDVGCSIIDDIPEGTLLTLEEKDKYVRQVVELFTLFDM